MRRHGREDPPLACASILNIFVTNYSIRFVFLFHTRIIPSEPRINQIKQLYSDMCLFMFSIIQVSNSKEHTHEYHKVSIRHEKQTLRAFFNKTVRSSKKNPLRCGVGPSGKLM